MGMELVVYVKNRDNRELEFSEVNGCREPNNAVMIDFFGPGTAPLRPIKLFSVSI